MESRESELLLQLEAERQRFDEYQIESALGAVLIHTIYMAAITYLSPEGGMCKSHPWVLRFIVFNLAIAFASALAGKTMRILEICPRFVVRVLIPIAVGFMVVAFGTVISALLFYGFLEGA